MMTDDEEIILTEAAEELAQQHSAAEPAGDYESDGPVPMGLNGQLHEIRLGDDIFDDDEAMVVRTDTPVEGQELQTQRLWKIIKTHVIYIQCYFVTIACILGTGILGLPVTLSRSGFYPFLLTFLIGFVMQSLLIYFFCELLQRAHAYQIENHKSVSVEEVQLPLREINDNDSEDGTNDANGETGRTYRQAMPTIEDVQRPNLHMLGTLFLGFGWRQLFDIILLLQFVFILISYALAGSMAYAQVFNIKYLYIIPVFVGILSISIVFAQHVIQPLISVLTLAKGGILVATVVVTFGVGAAVTNEITNDYIFMGQPFLMGTVALGGIMNVMPIMYQRIDFEKTQIRAFLFAVLAGLTTCMVLNVLWCWSVLDIVPQRSCQIIHTVIGGDYDASNISALPYKSLSKNMDCSQLSLERSEKNGEIATVPLTMILQADHPEYNWVAILIKSFIMISVSVSFLTMGSALMHSFLGWLDAQLIWERLERQSVLPGGNRLFNPKVCRPLICMLLFGLVLAVAMLDPKGFVVLLDKISSLLLNLEGGVFMFFMVRKSHSQSFSNLAIPLPVSRLLYPTHLLLCFYFTFAVVYDVIITIVHVIT